MKLTEVIEVWDMIHTDDIGFCDLEKALDEVVGVENDIIQQQPIEHFPVIVGTRKAEVVGIKTSFDAPTEYTIRVYNVHGYDYETKTGQNDQLDLAYKENKYFRYPLGKDIPLYE